MSSKKNSKVRAAETAEPLDSTGRQRQLKRDEVSLFLLLFFLCFPAKDSAILFHRLFVKSWNKSLIRRNLVTLQENFEKINV